MQAQPKPLVSMKKPTPAPLSPAEKRILAGAVEPKEKRLTQLAVYVDPATVARIDKACGKGQEIGLGRSMWIRKLIMQALDKAKV